MKKRLLPISGRHQPSRAVLYCHYCHSCHYCHYSMRFTAWPYGKNFFTFHASPTIRPSSANPPMPISPFCITVSGFATS